MKVTDEKKCSCEKELRFFLPMIPPRTTAQQHRIAVSGSKPIIYPDERLRDARQKFLSALGAHAPVRPLEGALRLIVKWCFPRGKHAQGTWKATRPDTDNLQKLFKDCMAQAGFFYDDAQVASEIVEKFYADPPGIFVAVLELEAEHETNDKRES